MEDKDKAKVSSCSFYKEVLIVWYGRFKFEAGYPLSLKIFLFKISSQWDLYEAFISHMNLKNSVYRCEINIIFSFTVGIER